MTLLIIAAAISATLALAAIMLGRGGLKLQRSRPNSTPH